MQIDTTDHDIPIWIVWGWTIEHGEMSILNIALNYKHAKYTYECEKDNSNYLRVWIEPTHGNHSISGRHVYPNLGEIDFLIQDVRNSWQDRCARVQAFCSEIIRAYGNNNKEKIRKLANQYQCEFGLVQKEINLEEKE